MSDPYLTGEPGSYYAERSRSYPKPREVPRGDVIDIALRRMEEDRIRRGIIDGPKPEAVARTTRLAREAGEAPGLVEGREDDYERARNADRMTQVLGKYPAFGRWASDNPRGAAAAADDHESLSIIGRAWEVLAGRGQQLAQQTGLAGWSTVFSANELAETLTYPLEAAVATGLNMAGINAYDPDAYRRRIARKREAYLQSSRDAAATADVRAQTGNYWIDQTTSGLTSLGVSMAGTALAVISKNPRAAVPFIGATTTAERYRYGKSKGLDTGQALGYALPQGTVEALTEMIPAIGLATDILKGTGFGKTFARQLVTEIPGEQAATILQDFTDWAYLPENADKTLKDYINARPGAMLDTALATIGGTTAQTSIAVAADRTVRATAKVADRVTQAAQARREGVSLDKLAKGVEASKLRTRDAEALRGALQAQAEETGATDVYIPGEAARTYFQSDSYDPDSDPFAKYEDQANEAAATGGDVVIPLADALTDLVATPAWEALRPDMRLAAGGLSQREAEAFDPEAEMAELTDRMGADEKAGEPKRTAFENLAGSIASKFTLGGYTPFAGRQVGELQAIRAKARYGRFGRDLTGDEDANLQVKAILPEAAKPFVYRKKGKPPEIAPELVKAVKKAAKRGPSLLEFIRSKGGIEDPGGDLASMGAAKLKGISKAGQKKLIREAAMSQGGLIGGTVGNENSPDYIMQAAISAGYFPELMAALDQNFAGAVETEKPSINLLFAAIDRELRGEPVYSIDYDQTGVNDAAGNILRMLTDAGYDPARMKDADIRDVIAAMAEEEAGEGLTQLPDTLEIDGVQRPTRNSEGQPLAGTEEGVRAFWTWFGDSKVVDEEGRPLVVYHGTGTDIGEEFSGGNFFSHDPGVASRFAELVGATYGEDGQANVIPAYVKIEKPKALDAKGDFSAKVQFWGARSEWEDGLENPDFDGIIIENTSDEGTVFVPRAKTSIKSINNRGTFDPNDPRILHQGLFGDDQGTDPNADAVQRQKLKLRAEAPLRGQNKTGKAQDGEMGLGLFDAAAQRSLFQAAYHGSPHIFDREQSYGEGPRGRIVFDQNRAIIELFQAKNLSTPLHELSHLWLEELRFDASLDEAPDSVKADWQTVQDWFAANGHPLNPDGSIPTEAHEMWARAGEAYLMEGKAPSTALKTLFETFRGWLTAIYRTVAALKTPITPEIREVFDRLLATDEEIAAMAERQNLAALFKQAADAAMSEAEFAAYQRQVQDARAEASGKLLDKTMAAVRRRETKRWNDERATVMAETIEAMDATPLLRAFRNLRTQPMSEEWLREEMGEGVLPLLPRRVPPVFKPGGADPVIIAELSGFATGRQMVDALLQAEATHRAAKEGGDQRTLRQRMLDQSADAEMNRRHGDALNDGSIEREALEAVHNDLQGEVIATELRALSRKSGKKPTPYALAKEWAKNRIRSGKVADEASPAAIQRYARAAAKAGREAEAAMLKQDAAEAFRQKQFQLLNNALVSEAKAAADDVAKAVRYLDDIARTRTRKSIDQDYLDEAHALLEDYDFRPRTNKELAERGRFEAWADARRAEGHDVLTPDRLAPIGTNWKAMSADELIALEETVRQVIHLGRFKKKLRDNKAKRDFEEVVSEAVAGTDGIGDKPPSDLMEPTRWDEIRSRIASIDAALLKMETVFDWLDRGNPNGVFNRIVFRPIAEAQDNARVRMNDVLGRLNAALETIPAKTLKRWNDKVTTALLNRETGNPFVFTRKQLVSMALNMGNAGNRAKLAGGYGWNEQAIMDALNAELTAEEWAYVQQVWDTIDSLWPEIEAMERRINGIAPENVEAVPFETPFGTLRGGYFPVIYDPRRNYDAEANAAKGRDLFENIYTRATTPKGFTKERTQVQRPIHLSLDVINRHVAEVIHDLTHREAIMQADKFLSDKRIMKAVDEALGPEIRQLFRPWLQRIANQWAYDRAGMAGLEGFLNKMRTNATVVGMGFRFTTVMVQAAGYTNSFEVVGERWVAPRIKDVANPAAWRFVFEKSKEVEGRMQSLDRDISDAARRAAGGTNLRAVDRFVFHGIGYMDRLVVIPTWLGAYDKALSEGMGEDDAVYAADKAVRQSQGSGAAKDLAAVQAGRGTVGALAKYLTMFYSFMSALYQRQRTLGRDVVRAKSRDAPRLIARTWWLLIAGPVLAEILAGRMPGEDDDEETWASWAAEIMGKQFVGPIPIARDLVPVLVAKAKDQPSYGYRFTPAQGGIEAIARVADDAERLAEGEETKRATRNLIEMVGYTTGSGLFTGQIAASTQFLVDVGSGDADPEGFAEWYEGLTTGRIKESAD